jgi:hypothetical protein
MSTDTPKSPRGDLLDRIIFTFRKVPFRGFRGELLQIEKPTF